MFNMVCNRVLGCSGLGFALSHLLSESFSLVSSVSTIKQLCITVAALP